MKKAIVLSILVGALCAIVLSCGSTGGGGGGAAASAGEVFYGNWEWEETSSTSGDGDTSTCFMTVAEEVIDGQTVTTYSFSGEVTEDKMYGLGQWRAIPADEETLEKLRTCTAVSFKIIGDGKTYIVELASPNVKDYGYHVRNIRTEEGTAVEHSLPIRSFTQPAWAVAVRFQQSEIDKVNIKTRNNAEGGLGPYAVKIWDLKLLM